MMYGNRIERVHGPFVDDLEVEKVVSFWKEQGKPEYIQDMIKAQAEAKEEDSGSSDSTSIMTEGGDLYQQAVAIVIKDKKPTTSYLQRRLKVGYNKAASLIEKMEQEGIVSAPSHTGKREILVNQDELCI